MTLLIRIVAAALVLAAPLAWAAEATASRVETSVPIHLAGGRPALPVLVGDDRAELTATLDTGAMGISIRQSVAQRLGLPVVGEAMVGSPFGGEPVSVKVVSLPGLSVGGAAQVRQGRSLDAIVLDDARFIATTDLVIGPNQFPGRLLELNLAQQRFRILPAPAVAAAGWLPTGPGGLLKTELLIQGQKVPAHIDTGSPFGLDLPDRLAEQLNLAEPPQEAGQIRTVNTQLAVRTARWAGRVGLVDQALDYDGVLRFAAIPLANVGTAALRGAVIRIDTAHGRWQLAAPEAG